MTQQEKNNYLLRFKRFQQSRERLFAPKIFKAIRSQYNTVIQHAKSEGLEASLNRIDTTPISTTLKELYTDAATIYGAKVRADLQRQKARMPMGFSEAVRAMIEAYYKTDILNTSQGITDTTKDLIREVFSNAYEIGLGIDDIIVQLENTELSRIRARLIARTETVTAANQGAMFVGSQSGYPLNKEWLAAIDNRTRRDHAAVNGIVIPFADYFDVNGYKMMQPGDRGGRDGNLKTPAKEVCNCRCTVLMIPVTGVGSLQPVITRPSFVPAKTVKEAEDRMLQLGVKKADIGSYSNEHFNQMLRAIESVPKKAIPTIVTDKKGYDSLSNLKIKRGQKEWMGLSQSMQILDRSTFTYNYEKIVVINSKGFRTAKAMTERKIEYNNYYSSVKNGKKWYFNEFDGATHFHELGHVYDNSNVSTRQEWIDIANKWHKESNVDLLKVTTGEWKGVNGSEAFAEAFASYYGNDKKGLPNYVVDYFEKNIR